MHNHQLLCEKICEVLRIMTELPEDFDYDYPLFDQFDGRPHLALSSINALELVVVIYEIWHIDVPMEDIRKLVSVNAVASYLEDAGVVVQSDEAGGQA